MKIEEISNNDEVMKIAEDIRREFLVLFEERMTNDPKLEVAIGYFMLKIAALEYKLNNP